MGKIQISKRREILPIKSDRSCKEIDLEKIPGISHWDPLKHLLDEKKMGAAIIECLMNNDPQGVMEMVQIYLYALHINKKRMRENIKLPKSTMYNSFKHKNPTIKTLAKLMHAYAYLKETQEK